MNNTGQLPWHDRLVRFESRLRALFNISIQCHGLPLSIILRLFAVEAPCIILLENEQGRGTLRVLEYIYIYIRIISLITFVI